MSEHSGKRLGWSMGLALAVILIVSGLYWHKANRPKPAAKPQLAVVGVGLYLGRNKETHQFQVTRVFPDSPADKAGVYPGLILNKVDNAIAETNNIKGLSKLLMGPVGTKVRLEMIDTNGEITQVEVLREQFLNKSKPTP